MTAKSRMRRAETKRAKQEEKLLKEQTRTAQATRKQAETEATAAARTAWKTSRKGGATEVPAPPAGGDDLVTSLERLAALRDSGAISDADYETAKAQVLGGGAPTG